MNKNSGVKKNYVAVISLSLMSLSIGANAAMYVPPPSAEPKPVSKSGFYAGIGVGGIGYIQDLTSSVSSTSADGLLTTSQSPSQSNGGVGVNGTIFVGYDWYLPHKLFLAGEIFGDYTNTPITGSNTEQIAGSPEGNAITVSSSGTDTLQSVYGIRALPGYQLTDTAVVYGIVGYARAHVKNTTSDFTAGNDISSITWPGGEGSNNYNGYQLGLGSMIDIDEHFAVRGDIIYTGYPTTTRGPASFQTPTGQTGSASNSIEQYTIEGDVSLVYKFD